MRQFHASSTALGLAVMGRANRCFCLGVGAATASLVAWGLAFWPNDGLPLGHPGGHGPRQQACRCQHGRWRLRTDTASALGKVLGAVSVSAVAEPAAPSLVSRLALAGHCQKRQRILSTHRRGRPSRQALCQRHRGLAWLGVAVGQLATSPLGCQLGWTRATELGHAQAG